MLGNETTNRWSTLRAAGVPLPIIVLLAYAVRTPSPDQPSAGATAWEYGRLSLSVLPSWETGQEYLSGNTPSKGDFDEKTTWPSLYTKLGGKPVKSISVETFYDLLGSQGWEIVSETDQPRGRAALFKRVKGERPE